MPLGRGIVEVFEAIPERIEVSGHGPTWRVTGGSFESALAFAREAYGETAVVAREDRSRWWPRVTLTVTVDPELTALAPPLEAFADPAPVEHAPEPAQVDAEAALVDADTAPAEAAPVEAAPDQAAPDEAAPVGAAAGPEREPVESDSFVSALDEIFAHQEELRMARRRIPQQLPRRPGPPVAEADGRSAPAREQPARSGRRKTSGHGEGMTESILPAEGEHLTNGWEPDTPPDDTLKRRAVLVHASWPVAVAGALGRPWHRTDRWSGARIGDGTGALVNPVILTRPLAEADAAALVAEVGELIPPETTYFLLSPWLTPDFAPHGLALLGHPPLMLRLPAPRPRPDPDGVGVREVRDADDLALAERILVEGYPMPGTTPGSVLGAGLLDGTTRVWVGYVDGEPASVAAAHQAAGLTLVEYVAALPAARGRGAGAAVTWAATLADPGAPAVLVASDDGRPTYERMGFLALERWTGWLRPARDPG